MCFVKRPRSTGGEALHGAPRFEARAEVPQRDARTPALREAE